MTMQLRAYESTAEFFYDRSFDDYNYKFYLCYDVNLARSLHIDVEWPREVYIMREQPQSMQLELNQIIGSFYPAGEDRFGIYGSYTLFDNSSLGQLLARQVAIGYDIRPYFNEQYNAYGVLSRIRLYATYIAPKLH